MLLFLLPLLLSLLFIGVDAAVVVIFAKEVTDCYKQTLITTVKSLIEAHKTVIIL
jgi:hypothetical protein